MNKVLKGRNAMMYIYVAIACAVLLVWRGGTIVTKKLEELQYKRLDVRAVAKGIVDTKSFYPVWVKQSVAVHAEAMANNPVDALFQKPIEPPPPVVEAPPPPKPVEPDYLSILRQSMTVESVSDNGAVINGRFFAVGEPIDEMGYSPLGKTRVVPVIAATRPDGITVRAGNATVAVPLMAAMM